MSGRKPHSIFPGISGHLLFAHRGFSALAPENTMRAFSLCLEHQIPGVELDVHQCRSGEIVVVHDHHLARLAGADLSIEESDYQDLRKLDVGSHFHNRFRGEHIPLLSEVLDLLKDRVYYDIELKTEECRCDKLAAGVLQVVADSGLADRVLFSSFNPLALLALKRGEWTRNAIIYTCTGDLPFYLRHGEGRLIAGCPIVKPSWMSLRCRPLLKRGLIYPAITWTVDDAAYGIKLFKSGITGIISNNPVIHLPALSS